MLRKPWLRRGVGVLVVLLVTSAGFSRLLRLGRVHRYLSVRLEAAFGRPVEVGAFNFSLLDGLRLEADSVTVAEDPRFGNEYFLRAERLTAGPRWRSLTRGRFEFGTLSFTRPSLNLVRAADGRWNVENWLPPPGPAAPAAAGSRLSTRLYRIEVDAGRINFKQGADKIAFALGDVKGGIEQESAGRWRMDLEARPMRATVGLQEAGTLRLRGRIAGTSARLQPADLSLSWQDVSLADALRLARGQDYGVRGRLAVELTARILAPGLRWSLAGTARLTGVHRWDLPPRPGDPALNLNVVAQWRPGETSVEVGKWVLEAPRSSAQGTGRVQWAPDFDPRLQLASSGISFADLLAWYRAFRPGVAEGLALEGHAAAQCALAGWPLLLMQGAVTSNGALLRAPGLRGPIRLGHLSARVARGRLEFDPTAVVLPAGGPGDMAPAASPRPAQVRQANLLRADGAIHREGSRQAPGGEWKFEINLAGQTDRAEDLLAAASALGYTVFRDWVVEGSAGLNLHWQGSVRPFVPQPLGNIELRSLRLRARFLNQPVILTRARVDLWPSERRITLSAAHGFGARWEGWLSRSTADSPDARPRWEFDLSADRLDAAELDRWLGPRARPGLLERIMPFAAGGSDSSVLDVALAGLLGRGQIRVDEVEVPPLSVRRLRARAEVAGREITLHDAQADFYGGTVKGSLRAELLARPSYRLDARFEGVKLGSVGDATASLKGRFAGTASGGLELAARGIGRENLLASLEGRGTLRVRGAQLHGLDLKASYRADHLVPGTTQFASAEGAFRLATRKVQVEELRLSDREGDFEAAGSVDFSRTLDLRVHLRGWPRAPAGKTLRIAGPLGAPEVNRVPSPAPKP